jgi:hypothetical protein
MRLWSCKIWRIECNSPNVHWLIFCTLGTLAKIWGQRDGLANYRPSYLKREGPPRRGSWQPMILEEGTWWSMSTKKHDLLILLLPLHHTTSLHDMYCFLTLYTTHTLPTSSRTSSFLLFHALLYSLAVLERADPTRQLRLQIGEPYPRDTIKRSACT